jgi:predicted nucleic-acid-binding protein
MIGLDTNVLLRSILNDHPVESRQARAFIATHCTAENKGYINRITLCELIWVLGRSYGFTREAIAGVVERLLATEVFVLEDSSIVASALNAYRLGGVDFPDLLIAEINRNAGCSATATFDRRAAKLGGFKAIR